MNFGFSEEQELLRQQVRKLLDEQCPMDEVRRLIDYLASADIERRLRESDSRNYPVRPALRDQLDVVVPSEASIDYAAAAARLIESDALMQDVLLR